MPELKPLVSVVIPCFNQARFLGQAIDSALAQRWRPIEIVVVNDGSTDDTPKVISDYPQIKSITQANSGPAAARNAGLRASRAEYVTFLDADDLLLPSAIEIGMREFVGHPDWAFVTGRHRFIDEHGKIIGDPPITTVSGDPYTALLLDCHIQVATVLHRRAVLEHVGGFDTSLRGPEDWDLHLRIARQFPIGQHNQLVSYYRRHPASLSSDRKLMLDRALVVLERQRPYIGQNRDRQAAYRARRHSLFYNYCRYTLPAAVRAATCRGQRRAGLRAALAAFKVAPQPACRASADMMLAGAHRLFRCLLASRFVGVTTPPTRPK